jgi:citrate synthase
MGNLDDPRLPFNYRTREYGTVPLDKTRAQFQWVSEVAYKNVHRIVARGYDTTELVEEGYGLVDILFIDFQSRIPLLEEEQMLNYIMILCLEDGLSTPAILSRMVAQTKTFLTQACGTAVLAFGHAYGAYSAFGNRMADYLAMADKQGLSLAQAAAMLVQKSLSDESLGVSTLMLKDPAAHRIFARAEKLGVAGPYVAFMKEVVKAAQEKSPEPIDLDFLGATGAVMMDLGFTPEATWAILAITRSFGAGAHYIEEVERGEYVRLGQTLTTPQDYDGPPERPVPPLAQRDQCAKPAQTKTLDEWKEAFEQRKKLHGSGFQIVEEIEDPSKKTGIKSVGK